MVRRFPPGPLRAPYSAWKVLGNLEVDVLFAAAARLRLDPGEGALRHAFSFDNDPDLQHFNCGPMLHTESNG